MRFHLTLTISLTGLLNHPTTPLSSPSVEFSYDKQQQDLAWFYLFGYFWTSEFIVALGQVED